MYYLKVNDKKMIDKGKVGTSLSNKGGAEER